MNHGLPTREKLRWEAIITRSSVLAFEVSESGRLSSLKCQCSFHLDNSGFSSDSSVLSRIAMGRLAERLWQEYEALAGRI